VTARLLLFVLTLPVAACSYSSRSTLVDTLYQAPAGDRITISTEYTGHECPGTVPPAVTTWTRPGQPDRVLTVHGSLATTTPPTQPPTLQPRQLDPDHVIVTRDGELFASFDYDHARAYFGPAAQPDWARAGER
jgi:hypothetical protein